MRYIIYSDAIFAYSLYYQPSTKFYHLNWEAVLEISS